MKILTLIFLNLFCFIVVTAQDELTDDFKPSGKASGKVFWNYNYNFSEGADQRNTFALNRVYLGYSYNISKKISTTIVLDGAKKSEASEFTVFAKNAQLDWKLTDEINLSLGLIGLKQIDTQEKFWGYRYVFKTLQDEFKLGTTADLGVNIEVNPAPKLKANIFVLNGEGYTKLQDELGLLKIGGSILFEPVESIIIKGYYDIYGGKAPVNDSVINKDTAYIHTIDFFVGYKNPKFRIGTDLSYQLNGKDYSTVAENHDVYGITINGAYTINKKLEVFGMWYKYKSNKPDGESGTWNNKKDGDILLAGIQYTPVKGVKTSVNYRTWLFDNGDQKTQSFIFLNFEYAF